MILLSLGLTACNSYNCTCTNRTQNSIDGDIASIPSEDKKQDDEDKTPNDEIPTQPQQHVHTEVEIDGKQASCTESGLTVGKKCSVCGEILVKQEEINKLEHKYVNETCEVCGYEKVFDLLELTESDAGYTVAGFKSSVDKLAITELSIPIKYNEKPIISIEDGAFKDCSSLLNVTIGKAVTSIGDFAFYNCRSLESITIPYGVIYIGNSAFYFCSSLTNVEIPNSVKVIEAGAFYCCEGLKNITLPNSITSISWHVFSVCSSLESITIPESVRFIDGAAFKNCSSLKSVIIPDNVTFIGEMAFYNCTSLANIKLGKWLTTISKDAFAYCRSLTNVIIPDNVTSIGDYAFDSCGSLTSITIPSSVTSLDWNVFGGNSKIKTIYYWGTADEWAKITFNDIDLNLTSVKVYYYLETKPSDTSYNYWHYDVDGVTPIIWAKENNI